MKVFLLGKARNITGWLDGCAEGLRQAGHEVRAGRTNILWVGRAANRLARSERLGRPLAAALVRAVRRFTPDLILGLSAYDIPLDMLEAIAAIPNRAPLVGWGGDVFTEAQRRSAELFDLLAYADTAMVTLHRDLGFGSDAIFLPHAANPLLAKGVKPPARRERRMVFVANPTPHRRELLGKLHAPVRVIGPAWTRFPTVKHQITARRIGLRGLGKVYSRYFAVLNARNELNVLGGLNQRSFDPCQFGTAVVNDAQADLELCFEPGREVLVYRSAEELDELYGKLLSDPELARRVGEEGRRRVLSEHTYGRRLQTLIRDLKS